jgi:hypothetical protein
MNLSRFAPVLSIPLLVTVQTVASAQEVIPATLAPCLRQLNTERTPIERVAVSGKYSEGKRTYYALSVSPPGVDYTWDAVVSLDQSGCRVVAANPMGDKAPATAFLPISIARGLTFNVLKNTVQRVGGLQKYQAFLLQVAQESGNKLTLMPYEVWALNQLEIQIPPSIKIVTPK